MSILVDKNTKVLTQGITGSTGQLHTRGCKEYGTQMVAGVTPGRGGTDFEGIPIFNTVENAKKELGYQPIYDCEKLFLDFKDEMKINRFIELRGV